jgi:hypothetical protein
MAPVVPMPRPIAYHTMKDAVRAGYDYIVQHLSEQAKRWEYNFIVIGQDYNERTKRSIYYHTLPQTDQQDGKVTVQITEQWFPTIVAYCHTHRSQIRFGNDDLQSFRAIRSNKKVLHQVAFFLMEGLEVRGGGPIVCASDEADFLDGKPVPK